MPLPSLAEHKHAFRRGTDRSLWQSSAAGSTHAKPSTDCLEEERAVQRVVCLLKVPTARMRWNTLFPVELLQSTNDKHYVDRPAGPEAVLVVSASPRRCKIQKAPRNDLEGILFPECATNERPVGRDNRNRSMLSRLLCFCQLCSVGIIIARLARTQQVALCGCTKRKKNVVLVRYSYRYS